MPIDASNVMRVCSKCGKAARTGVKVLDDGSKRDTARSVMQNLTINFREEEDSNNE